MKRLMLIWKVFTQKWRVAETKQQIEGPVLSNPLTAQSYWDHALVEHMFCQSALLQNIIKHFVTAQGPGMPMGLAEQQWLAWAGESRAAVRQGGGGGCLTGWGQK